MHTDWQGFLNTPFEIVTDYQTVLEGETQAIDRAKVNQGGYVPGQFKRKDSLFDQPVG